MKKICKKTQEKWLAFDGDIGALAKAFPKLTEHYRTCSVCQRDVQSLVALKHTLKAQHLEISDPKFWGEFQSGLRAKLAQPAPESLWERWLRKMRDWASALVFQPAYRWGVALVTLAFISYFGFHTLHRSGEVAWDSIDFFYESYQEASSGNPFETSLVDPSDVLMTEADLTGGNE